MFLVVLTESITSNPPTPFELEQPSYHRWVGDGRCHQPFEDREAASAVMRHLIGVEFNRAMETTTGTKPEWVDTQMDEFSYTDYNNTLYTVGVGIRSLEVE
jgi:hypothetical protein